MLVACVQAARTGQDSCIFPPLFDQWISNQNIGHVGVSGIRVAVREDKARDLQADL